jgi:hypothetical protein
MTYPIRSLRSQQRPGTAPADRSPSTSTTTPACRDPSTKPSAVSRRYASETVNRQRPSWPARDAARCEHFADDEATRGWCRTLARTALDQFRRSLGSTETSTLPSVCSIRTGRACSDRSSYGGGDQGKARGVACPLEEIR